MSRRVDELAPPRPARHRESPRRPPDVRARPHGAG